jgi:hypothetical protein
VDPAQQIRTWLIENGDPARQDEAHKLCDEIRDNLAALDGMRQLATELASEVLETGEVLCDTIDGRKGKRAA